MSVNSPQQAVVSEAQQQQDQVQQKSDQGGRCGANLASMPPEIFHAVFDALLEGECVLDSPKTSGEGALERREKLTPSIFCLVAPRLMLERFLKLERV